MSFAQAMLVDERNGKKWGTAEKAAQAGLPVISVDRALAILRAVRADLDRSNFRPDTQSGGDRHPR